MDNILVSCCNGKRWTGLSNGGACLVVLDTRTLTVKTKVSANQLFPAAEGATGICRFKDGFAVNLQGSGNTMIGKVNLDLEVEGLIQTANVTRPHSIVSQGSVLYAVSSGNDSVVKLHGGTTGTDPSIPEQSKLEAYAWTYDDYQRKVHVNSLWPATNNDFYVTAFGVGGVPSASSTDGAGFLMEMRARKVLAQGLYEPHSCFVHESTLLYCESGRSVVRDLTGGVLDLSPGYTRGIAASSDRLYVGISEPPDKSISGSTQLLDPDQKASVGAELRVFSWRDSNLNTAEEIARVDLRSLAREVFDIVLF